VKLALLVAILFSTWCAGQPICPSAGSSALLRIEMCWADYYSRAYGVPLEFVQAVIDVESAWQPYVVSPKGAAGIMQLMPPTASTFGVTNRFRVQENIHGGVAYLSYLSSQFRGDLRLVAAAYYAGELRIKKQGLRCADVEICRYVREVQRLFAKRQAAARAAALNSTTGEHQ
jgi:hypothetical protein